MNARRVLVYAVAAVAVVGASPAGAAESTQDFYSCQTGGEPFRAPVAPHTDDTPSLPLDSIITVPTTQLWGGNYQQTQTQIGNQVFNMTLDTGSSWMVLNKHAVADNAQIVPTGQTAAVTYGGGATCAAGPVVTAPVSIGGRKPQQLTFLLAESGNFPFLGIIGINTWQPPASTLDNPLPSLGIDTYEITLPRTGNPQARGNFVLNAQPTIDRANQRRVAVFKNQTLKGGNRVFIPGTITTNRTVEGAFMLDIGTPQNIITVFPQPATELGYSFADQTWASPKKAVRVEAYPTGMPPFPLRSSVAPTKTGDMFTITSRQVTDPYAGVTGLAGTSAIIGADYVRDWVMGVHFTEKRGVVRLLARDRTEANITRCGQPIAPARIRRNGKTRLLRAQCRVNGSPMRVSVDGPDGVYELIKRANGSVWIKTNGVAGQLKISWKAPAYVYYGSLRFQEKYRL